MKLIGLSLVRNFYEQYPDSRNWLENWVADVNEASWKTVHDLKARYPSCSLVGGGRVYFNVRGNNYRMEATIAFNVGVISVTWIGTHADYTKRMK